MKINVIKEHHFYPIGEHDVADERAKYLILIGVAEVAEKEEHAPAKEKAEIVPKKEKKETKTGNVPTAKKK